MINKCLTSRCTGADHNVSCALLSLFRPPRDLDVRQLIGFNNFRRETFIVIIDFCARIPIYPNNAFYSVTSNVLKSPKSFNEKSWDCVFLAQALHFLPILKPTVLVAIITALNTRIAQAIYPHAI
jgi:hypothetical protein